MRVCASRKLYALVVEVVVMGLPSFFACLSLSEERADRKRARRA